MAKIDYIIPFTYKWEGGLSRATTDTASKNASPYTINGKTGWHTNKGITYPVFKAGATKYGYADTLENFKNMPEFIWLKIAKADYWDKLKLDTVKSQAVANIMFSWIWGSGYAWVPRISKFLESNGIKWEGGKWVGKTLKLSSDFGLLASKLNELTNKIGEKKAFDELAEQKKEFLLSLKQPANEKGWLNRLNELKTYSYTLLGDATQAVKKNPLITAAITTALLVGTWLVVRNFKK